MNVTLKRIYNCSSYCIGRFYVNGLYVCDTIEDYDRGLKDSWPLDKIWKTKVYGETAIPKGTYKVVLSVSPKFRTRIWAKKYDGLVPEITGVKGFEEIRVHPANFATELLGCIAPGKNSIKGQVTQSQVTYYNLMDKYLLTAWKRKEDISITIE